MQMDKSGLLWGDFLFELGCLAYVRENLQVRLIAKNIEGWAKKFVFSNQEIGWHWIFELASDIE